MYLRMHLFVNRLDKLLSMVDGLIHVRTDMRALQDSTSKRSLLLELFLHLLVRLEVSVQSRQPGSNLAVVLDWTSLVFCYWVVFGSSLTAATLVAMDRWSSCKSCSLMGKVDKEDKISLSSLVVLMIMSSIGCSGRSEDLAPTWSFLGKNSMPTSLPSNLLSTLLEAVTLIGLSIDLLWSDEADAVLDEVNLLLDPRLERIYSNLAIVLSLMDSLLNMAHLVSNSIHLLLFVQDIFNGE